MILQDRFKRRTLIYWSGSVQAAAQITVVSKWAAVCCGVAARWACLQWQPWSAPSRHRPPWSGWVLAGDALCSGGTVQLVAIRAASRGAGLYAAPARWAASSVGAGCREGVASLGRVERATTPPPGRPRQPCCWHGPGSCRLRPHLALSAAPTPPPPPSPTHQPPSRPLPCPAPPPPTHSPPLPHTHQTGPPTPPCRRDCLAGTCRTWLGRWCPSQVGQPGPGVDRRCDWAPVGRGFCGAVGTVASQHNCLQDQAD